MRKVLIVTHDFPGGGGGRVPKLVQHLPGLGYEPIVLATKTKLRTTKSELWGNGVRVFRTVCLRKSPFRIFSRLFGSWRLTVYFENLFFIPDLFITWVPSALFEAYRLIREEKVDVILTTSPPESLHLIGMVLKELTGVTWIADFRKSVV